MWSATRSLFSGKRKRKGSESAAATANQAGQGSAESSKLDEEKKLANKLPALAVDLTQNQPMQEKQKEELGSTPDDSKERRGEDVDEKLQGNDNSVITGVAPLAGSVNTFVEAHDSGPGCESDKSVDEIRSHLPEVTEIRSSIEVSQSGQATCTEPEPSNVDTTLLSEAATNSSIGINQESSAACTSSKSPCKAMGRKHSSTRPLLQQQPPQPPPASSVPVRSRPHAGARLRPPPVPLSELEVDLIDKTIAELRKAQGCDSTADVAVELDLLTIMTICKRVEAFFLHEPSLLHLQAPINIVGDIHGQFLDLLRYFEEGGFPPNANYLFLGDYVDRGRMGIECTILLFCYKLRYPDRFFMLRGNHECSQISRMYGFYDECKAKYNEDCWSYFNDVFRTLPLAAIVSNRLFATHGGLSPDLQSLDDIDKIQRPTDVPINGLLCDLLWADPNPDIDSWDISDRGVSFLFGKFTLEQFLAAYDFDLFVRAHQVVEEGYEFFPRNSRRLVTVFSAANYCGSFDNAGAMLLVNEDLVCSFHVLKPQLNTIDEADILDYNRPGTPRLD